MRNFTDIRKELDPNKVLFCLNNEGELVHERFQDIPDYEGFYQVSTFGRVKSLARIIQYCNRKVTERILKQSYATQYLAVALNKDGIGKTFRIHQLMAITFMNHKPCNYDVVIDHKDNIKANNFEWNLQLITQRENMSKDRKNGTSKYTGVAWNKRMKQWKVSIRNNGIIYYLGCFESEEEASEYYQNALKAIKNGTEIKVKKAKFSSKYKGVSWSKCRNKWRAHIIKNKKIKHLGYFVNEYDAYLAIQNY